jgi:hypothetical protein
VRRARFPNLPAPLPVGDNVEDFGEAVRALAPQHRAFVLAYVDGGTVDAAMKAAGFHASTVRSYGSKLLRRPDVGAALQELGRTLLRGEGARSIRTMIDLRDDPKVPPPTRLRAAEAIADRSGFHVVSESHEHHHVHMTEAEQDRRILALCAQLGMSEADAQKMLIAPSDMQRNGAGVFELTPARDTPPQPASVIEPGQSEPAPEHQPHWGQLRRPNPGYVAERMREYRARKKSMTPEQWQARQLLRKAARDLGVTQPPATLSFAERAVGEANVTIDNDE